MVLQSFLTSNVVSLANPILVLFLCLLLTSYLFPYFFHHASLQSIPGPIVARFSNLWLLLQARRGRRFLAVDAAHERYGAFVRIQPDHVSVADEAAIPLIYGHGNGFLKSGAGPPSHPITKVSGCTKSFVSLGVDKASGPYYDAFVSIQRGLFNTRDRAQHSRKRKIISHTFSARSIGQFEQYIHASLHDLMQQWTHLSDEAQTSLNNAKAYAEIDSLDWFNYLAFDIIGDLAFGRSFGMLKAGADRAAVYSLDDPMAPPSYAPAVQVLNRRGEVSNTLGSFPKLKPWAAYLPDPFFSRGLQAVQSLAGIATAAVKVRLEQEKDPASKSDRKDLLARLMEGKDDDGAPMSEGELTAEALTQLIAGSDTTSNTSCAFFYWATRTPGIYARLRAEVDAALSAASTTALSYASVQDLPYLHACINETLRIHSTSSLGLPRIVTDPDGITITTSTSLSHHFPQGTVLSVPSYTLHHSKRIWGSDAEEFNPDRWTPCLLTAQQRSAFIPFSTGPRACVGRNLAEMELALIVATIVRNFDLELRQDKLETREGFLRKPLACIMGVRRRQR